MFIRIVARRIRGIATWYAQALNPSDFPTVKVGVIDLITGSMVVASRHAILIKDHPCRTILFIPPGVAAAFARGGLAEAPDEWVSEGILPAPFPSWAKLSPASDREWLLRGTATLLAIHGIRKQRPRGKAQ